LKNLLVETSQPKGFLPQPRSPGSLAFRHLQAQKQQKTKEMKQPGARSAPGKNLGYLWSKSSKNKGK